jgi:hypothetical protein
MRREGSGIVRNVLEGPDGLGHIWDGCLCLVNFGKRPDLNGIELGSVLS